MISPRSRGKGGRRGPWRDGGRGKQKAAPPWRRQAMHAIEAFSENFGETLELNLPIAYGRNASELMYKFDQRAAAKGIRYQVELRGSGHHLFFVIRVLSASANVVDAIIAQVKEL